MNHLRDIPKNLRYAVLKACSMMKIARVGTDVKGVLASKAFPDLTKTLAKMLSAEGKRVATAAVKDYTKAVLMRTLAKVELQALDLSGFDAIAKAATAASGKVYAEAFKKGAAVKVKKDATAGISTDQIDIRALDFSARRAAELVGKRIVDGEVVDNPNAAWSITETTRTMIQDLVIDAIDEGLSADELAALIEDSVAFSEMRAETIARTELAFAHVAGNKDGWKQAGVEKKASILGSEHDDDDECDEAEADGPIPIDDNFSNGMDSPPYHPRCVCDLIPVLGDEESDNEKVNLGLLVK